MTTLPCKSSITPESDNILTANSVNEIFDPDRIDPFFAKPEESRLSIIKSNKVTNYGVVRLELLERIYQTLYMQRVRSSNEEDWQHKILAQRTVVAVDSDLDDSLRLHVARGDQGDTVDGEVQVSEILDFDAVIVATGYLRDSHEWLLRPARHLLPGGDVEGKKWEVTRDYKVKFEQGTVSDDAGIYLQGCCESTHGVSFYIFYLVVCEQGWMLTYSPAGRLASQYSLRSRRRDRPVHLRQQFIVEQGQCCQAVGQRD